MTLRALIMVEAEPVVEMMGDTVTAGEDIVGDIAEDIAVGALSLIHI